MSSSRPSVRPPARPVSVGANGTVRLPASLRREMAIEQGAKFMAVANGNVVMLVPVVAGTDLYGVAKGADTAGYRDHGD